MASAFSSTSDEYSDTLEAAAAFPTTSADDDDSDIPEADPDAKIYCDKQEVFAKSLVETTPQKLEYEKTIKTKNIQCACWRTTDDDSILLGGLRNPILTVLHADGTERIYKILKGESVYQGLPLTNEKHLICVDGKYVYTVNIVDDVAIDHKLHPVNELNIKDPRWIFSKNKLEYAVLCDNPRRVEFFTLKNLLMDSGSSNSGFINLDMQNTHMFDKACFTNEGLICVTSKEDDVIYIYNEHGHMLEVIGTQRSRFVFASVKPGLLFCPASIQCCGGAIIVSCQEGDVHSYHDGKWSLLMKDGNTGSSLFKLRKKFNRTVFTENRMWAIQCASARNFEQGNFQECRYVHLYKFV